MTALTCAFGRPWPHDPAWPWVGLDHCELCHDAYYAACVRFAEAVRCGEHDAEGYTTAERRKANTNARTSQRQQ